MIRPILFGILLWAVCLYAFRRGGREEQIAALGMVINAYGTLLVVQPLATRFQHVEVSIVYVDIALILLLLWLALRTRKFWPLWLCAMQSLGTLSHFGPLVPHIIPWAYAAATALWMYPMLIVLAFAIRRRDQMNAKYPN
jgi:hypothetical protein